jgi:hypothetical protein
LGLTSASNTTNTDFLAGASLSFARRVLFITPSADFGRRDELAPGFKLGGAKGSLTSVPTRSHCSRRRGRLEIGVSVPRSGEDIVKDHSGGDHAK